MKNQLLNILFIIMSFSSMKLQAKDMIDIYRDLPFEMPVIARPVIPDLNISLTDFGGSGDGVTL
ncbi:glycoside hydrolase family 28 protein, partial [Bacteroides cellulosilyticus]|nr:glycoside hydrolase family 28 protein [Bacteroides cellulosilyticus]